MGNYLSSPLVNKNMAGSEIYLTSADISFSSKS